MIKQLIWAAILLSIFLGFNVGVLLGFSSWRPCDAPPASPSNISITPVPDAAPGRVLEPDLAIGGDPQP